MSRESLQVLQSSKGQAWCIGIMLPWQFIFGLTGVILYGLSAQYTSYCEYYLGIPLLGLGILELLMTGIMTALVITYCRRKDEQQNSGVVRLLRTFFAMGTVSTFVMLIVGSAWTWHHSTYYISSWVSSGVFSLIAVGVMVALGKKASQQYSVNMGG